MYLVILLLLTNISFAKKAPVTVSQFLQNKKGGVLVEITQSQAENLCQKKSSQLLSAREMALEATYYGAQFLDYDDVDPKKIPKNFYLVEVINQDGQPDRFYYSFENYKRPKNERGNYWSWSSSYLRGNKSYAFTLSGAYGTHGFTARGATCVLGAARCQEN